ncbi:MAG: type II toxin-antitoxin system mRNA interferase toxin, RelE/StbE family [Patescibacteria group bacterium]|jgi:addiction module RelE/StbE family toxin
MLVRYHRDFKKQFQKLTLKQQSQFDERLAIFSNDPFASQLNNHSLRGVYQGCRSINISGDLRVIYVADNEGVALLIAIGTHSQLYG